MKQLFSTLFIAMLLSLLFFSLNESTAQERPADIYQKLRAEKKQSLVKKQLNIKAAHAEIDWEEGYLVITAYGASKKPNQYASYADMKVEALNAAWAMAVGQLAEVVFGVRVTGTIGMKNLMQYDVVQQRWSGFLKNVRSLSEYDKVEEMPDGSLLAQSTVAIPIYGEDGFIPTVMNHDVVWKDLLAQTPAGYNAPPPQPQQKAEFRGYTGLILDCREMADPPVAAVMPRIITPDGKSVYGVENVPRELFMNGGLVGYATSLESEHVEERVGDNPLFITPVSTSPDNSNHVIVSQSDANKILWADQQSHFREQAKVLFLY